MLFKTLLVIVLSVSGVLSRWGMTYTPERICALEGSSVDMHCTYSYPTSYTVKKTFWFIYDRNRKQNGKDLSQDPEYSQRVEYLGNQNNDCTFRINQLRQSDSRTYRFRFLGNGNGYTGRPGVTLEVTDLQLRVNPDLVTEGQSVTLICSTTCTLTGNTAFIWYRDGSPLSITDQRHQSRASSEDRSRYTCAVKGYEHLHSPAVALNVRYPPKNISVSVSPSGEIVEGSSVTLTCSSDANPPVRRYAWYKNNRAVSSETGGPEHSYTIKHITLQDAGEYICQPENAIGTNRSPPKRLDLQYAPKNISVSVSPSGEIVEDSSVTLTCSSDANPPVQSYIWFKKNDTGVWQAGSGQSLNFSNFRSWNSGQYYCESQNRHGAQNASVLLVTVQRRNRTYVRGQSLIVAAAVGVAAILALVFLGVLCVRRRKTTNEIEGGRQGGRDGDTYTSLQLPNIIPDYDVLQGGRDGDTYAGLQLHNISPDYDVLQGGRDGDTYAGLQLPNISPDYDVLQRGRDGDTYAGLQLHNISPDYDVLQVKNKHQKDTVTAQEQNDDYENTEDGNRPDSGAN